MGISAGGKGSSGRRRRSSKRGEPFHSDDVYRFGVTPPGEVVNEGQQPGGLQTPIVPGQAQKPFRPIENPFPEKKEFRLGGYVIIEEKDDYLVCRGYDPNAKDPFAQITPAAYRTIKIAKPSLLQRTVWEDAVEVPIRRRLYTYVYTALGVRTASWTDIDDATTGSEEQTIDIPYFVDDVIVAVELRKNEAVDGIDVTDETDGRLSWMDLNISGRHWTGPIECAAQNEIQIINIFGSPTGGTFDLDVTVDGTEETMTFNWDDTADEVKTQLETHSKIASGDVNCTAGPFPDSAVKVEFQGDRANVDIPIMMPDHGSLTGGTGVSVFISVDQHGRA